jgi:hypothetical protein
VDDIYKFQKDGKELAEDLQEAIRAQTMTSSVAGSSSNWIHQTWLRNLWSYYSPMLSASGWESALQYTGEQGELIKVAVPQARALLRQFVAVVTKERLAYECMSDSSDSKTFYVSRIGKALLEQTVKDEQLDIKREEMVEAACLLGVGYLMATWRTDKGYIYSVDEEGNPAYSGKLDVRFVPPWDVFKHSSENALDDLKAVTVKVKENRWDLIAQFPTLKDDILKLPSSKSQMNPYSLVNFAPTSAKDDDDEINVFLTFHVPSPSVPMGRILIHAEGGLVINDIPENPIEMLPIVEVRFEKIIGSAHGYPMFSSLLPCQEMFDHCFSVTATNQAAFGVQQVLVPKGSDISVSDLGPLSMIHYKPQSAEGGGKPEPLSLVKTSPEVEAFMNQLYRHMELISNISGALRGQPPPGATSGVAIATLSANAIEFLNPAQKATSLAMERLGDIIIKTFQKFATVPQMLNIVNTGDGSGLRTKEFVGGDLKSLKKIHIRETNPMLQTASGRTTVADALLQQGLITNIQQYFGILEGRPVETLWDTDVSEVMAVQSEIDGILSGEQVIPLITDNHPLFIRAYLKLLYERNFRVNSQLVGQLLQLVQQRTMMEQQLDPFMKAMLRTGNAPQMQPPQQGGGKPGGGAAQVMGPNTQETAQPAESLLNDQGGMQ